MSESTAMEKSPAPAAGFGEMIQQAPQPQGLTPTVVPLDRETLAFYGNMITAAGLVPVYGDITPEVAKFRVMAKIVAGVSYGFDPVLSQQCFDIMFNSLAPNARCMEILFKDSGEYDWRAIYHNETGCHLKILQRHNGDWDANRGQYTGGEWRVIGEVEYTVEMARTAGLYTKKDSLWPKYPADLSFARCVTRAVKRFNPGCMRPRTLLGNYFAKQAPQIEAAQVAQIPEAAPVINEATAPVPVTAPEQTSPETHIDPPFVEANPMAAVDDDSEAVVVEYTGTETDHVAPEVIAAEPEDTDAAAEASAEEAETVEAEPIDEDESKLADLRIAVKEALVEKVGSLKGDQKVFLKGREIDNEDAITLGAMLADLNAM